MVKKPFLVCERSSSELAIQDSDKYVLEGIFTEFGVKNKNGRIYEEAEVIPHIEAMQKKISQKKLVGELDHPKSFDVSYKNASHVIEDLRYDKENGQVIGRIRLLNTTNGKEAQALVDAGIPLHISSRAAGIVENNGKVKIKKMFTYDLVADPGFENATLKSVNESYGFDPEGPIQLYEVDNIPADLLEEGDDKTNKNSEMTNEQYVSVADFHKFTEILKGTREKEMAKIREELKSLVESAKPADSVDADLAKRVTALEEENKKLNEELVNLSGFSDYVVEHLEKVIDYSSLIAKTVNEGSADKNELEKAIKYIKLLAENLDNVIEYQKFTVNETNSRFRYQNRINEHTDALISHQDYLVEAMDSFKRFGDHLGSGLNTTIKAVDELHESVKAINEGRVIIKTDDSNVTKIDESTAQTVEVNETSTISEDNRDIDENIDQILNENNTSAKEQKADNSKYPFYSFLSKENREKFDSLEEQELARVVEAFKKNKYFGSIDVERIWESAMNPAPAKLDWIKDMPSEYRPIWESLDPGAQRAIKAQASMRALDTEYKIANFWQTRDLRAVRMSAPEIQPIPINESSNFTSDDSYMESVKAGLKRRFNK